MKNLIEIKFSKPLTPENFAYAVSLKFEGKPVKFVFQVNSEDFGKYAIAVAPKLGNKIFLEFDCEKEVFFNLFNYWMQDKRVYSVVEPFFSLLAMYVSKIITGQNDLKDISLEKEVVSKEEIMQFLENNNEVKKGIRYLENFMKEESNANKTAF